MKDFAWFRRKDGNVIGSKITNPATGVTTARDHHGNTLGYGDSKRDLTLKKSGNLVRRDDDAGSLIK